MDFLCNKQDFTDFFGENDTRFQRHPFPNEISIIYNKEIITIILNYSAKYTRNNAFCEPYNNN